jgi:hypothetical protein
LSQFWINWKKIKTAWGLSVSPTVRTEAPGPHRAHLDSYDCRLVHPWLRPAFPPPFSPPSATASCGFKWSAPSKSSPFLLLLVPPHPCSPHRLPMAPLHPTPMRNHHCFPQATGHRLAHAPPSSLSKTVLKPQLQESLKRRPPLNPLSTEHCRVDRPLCLSPEATFAAMTSA